METISIPLWQQRRWGWSTSAFFAYLMSQAQGNAGVWFSVDTRELRNHLTISPQSISVARERLRADRAIDTRKSGISYEYTINDERVKELANESAA